MFARLVALLESLTGGSGSWSEKLAIFQTIFGVLPRLRSAENAGDYHGAAISLLEPLAPITETPVDDGALIALRALSRDPEWLAFVDDKVLAVESFDEPEAIPDGALALSIGIGSEDQLPNGVRNRIQELNVGATAATVLSNLPLLLKVLVELRRIAGEFRNAA